MSPTEVGFKVLRFRNSINAKDDEIKAREG